METFSALLALCAGNSPVTGEFPSQSPLTRSFDVFLDMCLNKRLSKQSRRQWFRTHYYVTVTQYPRLCTRQVTMLWRRKYVFMIVLSGNEPKYISGKFHFYNTNDLPLKLRDIQVAYLLMFITLLLAHILKIQHCIPKQVDKWSLRLQIKRISAQFICFSQGSTLGTKQTFYLYTGAMSYFT